MPRIEGCTTTRAPGNHSRTAAAPTEDDSCSALYDVCKEAASEQASLGPRLRREPDLVHLRLFGVETTQAVLVVEACCDNIYYTASSADCRSVGSAVGGGGGDGRLRQPPAEADVCDPRLSMHTACPSDGGHGRARGQARRQENTGSAGVSSEERTPSARDNDAPRACRLWALFPCLAGGSPKRERPADAAPLLAGTCKLQHRPSRRGVGSAGTALRHENEEADPSGPAFRRGNSSLCPGPPVSAHAESSPRERSRAFLKSPDPPRLPPVSGALPRCPRPCSVCILLRVVFAFVSRPSPNSRGIHPSTR